MLEKTLIADRGDNDRAAVVPNLAAGVLAAGT